MAGSADVAWFRSRLLPRAAGLLDPDESRRFDDLLARNAACGEIYRAFSEDPGPARPDEARHVPAGLLARWPAARRTLTGLERTLVGEHLASCEQCREDLRVLGFDPALDLPALEEPAHGGPVVTAQVRTRPRRDPVRGWLAAWATLATAASILLVALPRLRDGGDTPPAGPVQPAVAENTGRRIPMVAGALRGGSESDVPVYEVPAGVPFQVVIPPPAPPDGDTARDFEVTLELFDENGTLVARGVASAARMRTTTWDLFPAGRVHPGLFELHAGAAGAAPEIHRFRVSVTVSPP